MIIKEQNNEALRPHCAKFRFLTTTKITKSSKAQKYRVTPA